MTVSAMSNSLRIALVHDALINMGGAERVLTYMHECFPDAPIYTSVYLPNATFPEFRRAKIHTLPGSRWVHTERRAKQLYFLWMRGFRRLLLQEYDFVLVSTTWVAKFVRLSQSVSSTCYCYAPTRFLWKPEVYSPKSMPLPHPWFNLLDRAQGYLRGLDFQAMQTPTRLATTCKNTAHQILECYQRAARIIYAPIRVKNYFTADAVDDYYLTVARLVSHKHIELAIQACRALKRKLVIVGDGPERSALQQLSDESIHFTGPISDACLKEYYAKCRAVLFPSYEDYGLVPLEAQASGRPVIAYGAGGALETIAQGETGIFFNSQTVESLTAAIQQFESMSWHSSHIQQHARQFDVALFRHDLTEFVMTA